MSFNLAELYNQYWQFLEKYGDERISHLPLLSSPIPIIVILGLYFWFIKWKGPEMMKHRKPFNLNRILIVYNAAQSVTCAVIVIYVTPHMRWNMLCAPYDFQEHIAVPISGYIYFLMKVVDLLDTVFFVLRKKDNQITFLHVFHHSTMVYSTWLIVRFFCSGHSPYVGYINSIVHTVMYGYYLLTIIDKGYKDSIWWKKYITQLQLIQFGLFFVLFTPMLFMDSCQYPKLIALFIAFQNGTIVVLFGNFYYQNYIKKNTQTIHRNGKHNLNYTKHVDKQ